MLHVQPPVIPGLLNDHEPEEKTEFRFEELDDCAKERARAHYRKTALDHDWWGVVYSDVEEIAPMLGLRLARKDVALVSGKTRSDPCIYFSGFWSQGDGACFEGWWFRPENDVIAKVKEHAPQDEKLHAIAETFAKLAKRCARHEVSVTIKHHGNYSHEFCTTISVDFEEPDGNELQQMVRDALGRAAGRDTFESDITDALRSYMRWIYGQLRNEYEHLTSDEVIDEALSDGLVFTEDGEEI